MERANLTRTAQAPSLKRALLTKCGSKLRIVDWRYTLWAIELLIEERLETRNYVDGRNPAPVDRWFITFFWGFNHPRWCRISSIHSMWKCIATIQYYISLLNPRKNNSTLSLKPGHGHPTWERTYWYFVCRKTVWNTLWQTNIAIENHHLE